MRRGCRTARPAVPQVPCPHALAAQDHTDESPRRPSVGGDPGPRRNPDLRQRDGAAPGHRQGSGELMLTALFLFAVVVAGIHQEPPAAELTSRAPSRIASLARRLVGVYVRRPDRTDDNA